MASSLRELNLDPFGQQPQRIPIYRDEPEFVDRVRNNQNYPVINNPDGSVSTHRMAAESDANGNWYVFPTIQMQDGELVEYYDSRDAMDAAFKTGNILRAPNKQSALNYAEGAYKRDTGLGDRPVSTLRGLQELSPSDPLYIHQDPMPAGADIMTQQEAISELTQREESARVAGTVSPFQSSFNPFNPNFRATAQNAISNMLGGSNISSNPNYLQGRIANTLSGLVDFIPAVGDAVGVGDTITSYKQGDMLGTGINAAAAALGIVPVLGDAAGKGIKSLSSLRQTEQFGDIIQTAKAGDVNEYPVRDFINEKGYSINPLMAQTSQEVRPETIAKGSYNKLLKKYNENPIVRNRENSRLIGGRVLTPDNLFAQEGTYEQLLDRPLIPLPADKTIYGSIDRVAGVEIEPYLAQGGPQHFDKNGNWMSMSGAAKSKQGHANRVRAETKKDPVYVYMGMDNYGSNFAEPASVIASRYIKSIGGLSKQGEDILNRQMQSQLNKGDTKGIAESWKGYTTPEDLEEWLKTTDKYATAGNKRKAFMNILTNRELQAAGAPIPEDIYSILNEQAMMDNPAGFSGSRVMIASDTDPLSMTRNTELNNSYDTIIDGEGGAVITQPMLPWDVMFPDPAAVRVNKQGPYRSFQTSGGGKDYQMANESWMKGVNKYLSSLRDI